MPEIPHKQTALVRAPKNRWGVLPGDGSTGDRSDICGTGRIDFRHHGMACAAQCLQGDYGPGGSGLFFGASWAAENILRLSGQDRPFIFWAACFYFLPYWRLDIFGLLGPEFILKGENRYRVLLAGSIATEIALFPKSGDFITKVYTQACLWGNDGQHMLFDGSVKLEWPDCMNGMMYYSFLLIGEMRFTGRKSGLQGSMNAPADRFIDEFMGEFGLLQRPVLDNKRNDGL